ncbi:RICIN domain-containing protein [Fodinicola feengrottensis]|uniref:Ricin B lectin domain-containing protein n=2 Tax=Fodinicola feengrottensis TaxID=435914 RepID=A0ABN2GPY0_9ACTN
MIGAVLAAASFGAATLVASPAQAALQPTSINPNEAHIIENLATGLCLDDSNIGTRTHSCNNSSFQSWKTTPENTSGTLWRIRNVNTGGCLTNGTNGSVFTIACPAAPAPISLNKKWSVPLDSTGDTPVAIFESNTNPFGCVRDNPDVTPGTGLGLSGCGVNPNSIRWFIKT